MKTKLCPCCGKPPVVWKYKSVHCVSCFNGDCANEPETSWYNTEDDAIEAWNQWVTKTEKENREDIIEF